MGYGAIASVVGGIMQSIAASQEQKAMIREFQKELARQRGFQTEAWGQFNQRLPGAGAETARTQMATGQQEREKGYAATGATPVSIGHSMFSPTAIDQASAAMRGGLRAKLGSYGDWQHQQGMANTRFQDELNRISNFSSGWQQVEPYRMYDAQHSNDELAFWGQLISSIGGSSMNLASSFGGTPPSMGRGGSAIDWNFAPDAIAPDYLGDVNINPSLGGYA